MELAAGAGDRDVETLLSAHAIDCPEVHRELPGKVGPERHREEHDVAFVALDVLEILDDDRLLALVREEPLEAGVGPADLVEPVEDAGLLLGIERDYAEGVAFSLRDRKPGRLSGASLSLLSPGLLPHSRGHVRARTCRSPCGT